MHRPSISVVLPVYRNRPQLPELYRRLTETLQCAADRYELVFVDDAGPDGSLGWLRSCAERDARVVVVELQTNVGQHRAVLAGLRRSTGGLVVVMDADLQDPPEEIPRLVSALGTSGVVFARRANRHQPHGRHWTGLLFKRVLRRVARSRVPIGTGMFFVATRDVVDLAVTLSADAKYVPLLLDETNAPMRAIDVAKDQRTDNASAYTAWRRLALAAGAIRQAIDWRRIRRRDSRARDPHARAESRQSPPEGPA
ncbi:MAG: glycosyltransferase family 2 protein [Vicinamibacterales bacterium]